MERKDLEWRCQNKKCQQRFAEYVNGCPVCCTGEVGGSHKVALEKRLSPDSGRTN